DRKGQQQEPHRPAPGEVNGLGERPRAEIVQHDPAHQPQRRRDRDRESDDLLRRPAAVVFTQEGHGAVGWSSTSCRVVRAAWAGCYYFGARKNSSYRVKTTSTTISATIAISSRTEREASIRSVSEWAVSRMTSSLRLSAAARSDSSYSSARRA